MYARNLWTHCHHTPPIIGAWSLLHRFEQIFIPQSQSMHLYNTTPNHINFKERSVKRNNNKKANWSIPSAKIENECSLVEVKEIIILFQTNQLDPIQKMHWQKGFHKDSPTSLNQAQKGWISQLGTVSEYSMFLQQHLWALWRKQLESLLWRKVFQISTTKSSIATISGTLILLWIRVELFWKSC